MTLRLLRLINLVIVVFSVLFVFWFYIVSQGNLEIWGLPRAKRPFLLPNYNFSWIESENVTSFVFDNTTKTLLTSAYLEHRTKDYQVRVISVVPREQTPQYICTFSCQGKWNHSRAVVQIHKDHFKFTYGTADLMCSIPQGCEKPKSVAVTTHAPKNEEKLQFLQILNQNPKSDSFPYNFTVCLSTMFEFTNVLQLVQGLEMFYLLGVNKVAVYTTSYSHNVQLILDHYKHKGFLDVITWSLDRFYNVSHSWRPDLDPGELHYFGQIPALTDCLYRYMYRSKYVAMHDIDELILPQTVSSWVELLPVLEQTYGKDMCYKFENHVFPTNVKVPLPNLQMQPPQGCWGNVTGVNILAHLYQEPPTEESYKIIVNPRVVFSPTVHGVLDPETICRWVDRNTARMYHTRAQVQTNLKPDQLTYNDGLLSYSTSLRPAVDAVLKKCGLVPKESLCKA